MNKYKVCVYAICKNEGKFIDRWMDAVSEADLVVVADTGSTDDSVDRLRARGAQVTEVRIDPWRFDKARNAAMDAIPMDVDICVSNDIDEVFEPGWRAKLEAAWRPEHTRARYLFTWSPATDSTPAKQYVMEKIHRRKGYRWVHPVHEVLQYDGPEGENPVWVPGLVLEHRPDPTKPRTQYLPLLELSAAENPHAPQVIFWLGREYMYYGRYEESERTLKQYLALPEATWREERAAAMRFIARCRSHAGDTDGAIGWLLCAGTECPQARESFFELAELAYKLARWPLCLRAAEEGLGVTASTGSYLVDLRAWGYALHDYAAIALYRLGRTADALLHAQEALRLSPEDARLAANLRWIENAMKEADDHGTL